MLILAYHRVQPAPSDTLSVSTDAFSRQLRWLRLTGWQPARIHGDRGGGRTFGVTFDDGYRDNHAYAAPILQRLGVPATLFVCTGYVDGERVYPWRSLRMQPDDPMGFPLRRDQLTELTKLGFELGSHCVTHPHLTELRDELVMEELVQSKHYLEALTGRECRFLAYPFGSLDPRIVSMVHRAGFRAAFVTPTGPGVPDQPLTRHRVGVYGHDSLLTFALKTSGIYRRAFRRLIWRYKAARGAVS